EEPYSIAILLRQLIPDLQNWNIMLLATDINPHYLCKAAAGVFGAWSFRNAPAGFIERYFLPAADRQFEILPEIRHLVRFGQLNLMDDLYPAFENDTLGFDVIFCRNVLMYFTPAQALRV